MTLVDHLERSEPFRAWDRRRRGLIYIDVYWLLWELWPGRCGISLVQRLNRAVYMHLGDPAVGPCDGPSAAVGVVEEEQPAATR